MADTIANIEQALYIIPNMILNKNAMIYNSSDAYEAVKRLEQRIALLA